MMNVTAKLSLIIVGLMLSITLLAQSNHELAGTWKEAETQTKLVLSADLTGAFSAEGRDFSFQNSYLIWGTSPHYYLNYTIQMGGQSVPCYAIIQKINAGSIRFISFLSEEQRIAATEEILASGIILMKETL